MTPDVRELTPTIPILLGEEVRPLVPALTLAIARRSPAACRLTTSIDLVGRTAELPRLFRAAAERVTALPARNAAVRAGFALRDELFVPLILALGAELPRPEDVRDAIETLGVLAADYFRGTRVDLQAVLLLPDLGVRDGDRYRRAYDQLAVLDRAVGEEAPRLDGRPILRRRWIADCRTQAGAHAGSVEDTIPPLAEFLSTLTVGATLRELDAGFEGVLHGAHHGRITGYSAPGYAEIVFAPRVFARYFACRLGMETFDAVLAREPAHAEAPDVESAADECLAAMQLAEAMDALVPAPGPRHEEPAALIAHARARARARSREAALRQALEATRGAADRWGAPGARLFARVLDAPVTDERLGIVRAGMPIDRVELDVAERIREMLGMRELRARAEELEQDAAALLRPPAPEIVAEGEEEPVRGSAPPEPDPADLARAAELRKEAATLRARLAYLDGLIAPGGDLDALEDEVLAAGPKLITETPAEPEPPLPPAPAPEERITVPRVGLREIFSEWFGRSQAQPGPAAEAPPTPEAAPPSLVPGRDRIVEWLRWLREFRDDLRRLLAEVIVWEDEIRVTREYYERETKALGDELTKHRSFSHRLLSLHYCDELYAQRGDGLREALERSGKTPLSRYLDTEHTPLEPLQRPVNIRFLGLDPALDATALEVFADWLELSVEDVLFRDPWVIHRAHPGDRLRAMADSAEPLVRPEDPEVRPARSDVVLLPLPESEIPQHWDTPDGPEWIEAGDPRRCALRTSLHGFAAHALAQLRPVRERYRAGAEPPADEPLPRAVLVEEPLEELIVLGLALGHIRRVSDRLEIPGFRVFTDEAELAQRLRSHFDGRREAVRIARVVGREIREAGAVERLHDAAGSLGEGERALLDRIVEGLYAGRWPAALAWEEDVA